MSGDNMISIRGAGKKFGAFTALHEVSADIREGEFFSLLGPSGCGKTTLLRLIGGFDDPTSGAIYIGGQDMEGIPANKRPTNMVFQSYAIFPHLNVAENVAYGLKKLRLGKEEETKRVNEALAQVELTGLGPRMGNQLSGGQRQRVALARALVMRPKVLLLDEPLSALDQKLREQMQVELRQLQQTVGITFILVTHDQYEALGMSDRIAVMFGGEIAQIASPQEIYQSPVSRAVADFLGGMNFLTVKDAKIKDQVFSATVPGIGNINCTAPASMGDIPADAILGIRPERLRILWDDEKGENEITGTVAGRHYYGEVTQLRVAVPGQEHNLAVVETNDFGADDLSLGAKIRLAYDNDAFVVMRP